MAQPQRWNPIPSVVYGVAIGSSYQEQGLALSKQFRRPDRQPAGPADPAATPSPLAASK